MRRFRVDHLDPPGSRLTLDANAGHHATEVLRLRTGTLLWVFDGAGYQAQGILVSTQPPVVEVRGPIVPAHPPWPLHVGLGVTKAAAFDTAIRMATESGATHLHPILAKRSVARGDRHERWCRIASSAAQQCGRADVPHVSPMRSLRAVVEDLPSDLDARIALPGAAPLPRAEGPALVLIGPEGGWSPEEVELALTHECRAMGLAAWTLRADTATAVAVSAVAPFSGFLTATSKP